MKIIFGGIYKRKHESHAYGDDQWYGYYIPVAIKHGDKTLYKMVDTYTVKRTNISLRGTDMESRLWLLEQANCGETSYGIFYGHNDFYYQNFVELGSDNLDENEWELVADLHDYELVSDNESSHYLKQDLLECVPLWFEDSYRAGSGFSYVVGRTYVKKGAKKNGWLVYRHALYEYPFEFTSGWRLDELEKVCTQVLQTMSLKRGCKKPIKNTLKEIKMYRKLVKEWNDYCVNLDSKQRRKK